MYHFYNYDRVINVSFYLKSDTLITPYNNLYTQSRNLYLTPKPKLKRDPKGHIFLKQK